MVFAQQGDEVLNVLGARRDEDAKWMWTFGRCREEEEQWCHRRGRHMRLLSESSRVKKDIDPLSGSEFPLQDTGEMEREWRVSVRVSVPHVA
jgi:hypothetical protein